MAAVLGYLVLAALFMSGALLTRLAIDQAPYDPGTGGLRPSWAVALIVSALVAGVASGWVSRSFGASRAAVLALVAILLGLALVVVLIDSLIGPTPSTRAFLEELLGQASVELPMSDLWDGRPQTWFAVASYTLAVLGIIVGASLAERR